MKEIPLSRGLVALVDDEDYEKLNKYKWYADTTDKKKTFYAKRNLQLGYKKRAGLKMHRVIMNAKPGEQVDHRNGNGLDNRRSNLRIVTNQLNCFNTSSRRNTSSKYKGVSWHKYRRKWQADICKDGKITYLGLHDSEIEAAKVYDLKAKELFGEYARLNFN